jgi:hypothetical protein
MTSGFQVRFKYFSSCVRHHHPGPLAGRSDDPAGRLAQGKAIQNKSGIGLTFLTGLAAH